MNDVFRKRKLAGLSLNNQVTRGASIVGEHRGALLASHQILSHADHVRLQMFTRFAELLDGVLQHSLVMTNIQLSASISVSYTCKQFVTYLTKRRMCVLCSVRKDQLLFYKIFVISYFDEKWRYNLNFGKIDGYRVLKMYASLSVCLI